MDNANENLPKYKQVARELQSMIEAGRFDVDGRIPSGRELALQMGVTPMTVNKGLESLVHRGVLERIVGKGTFLRRSGEFSRRGNGDNGGKKRRIGILCHYQLARSWYSLRVAEAIDRFFAGREVELSSFTRCGDEYSATVQEYGLDAVIVVSPWCEYEAGLTALAEQRVPFVVIGCEYAALREYCFSNDDFTMAREAVHYLYDLGHRDIALAPSPLCCPSSIARLNGFLAGMWEVRLPVNPEWIVGGLFQSPPAVADADAAELRGLKRLLRQTPRPSALITMFYSSTLNVYRAAADVGIGIGTELSVLGFDDPESAEHLNPALTAYDQPLDDLVDRALRALENRCAGLAVDEVPRFTSHLTVRNSCGRRLP